MFLRFNEVRSSGEKQHDVVVVFVPPALVVASLGCVVDCERRRREQGGRESKEEVEIFWRSRELSHLPSLFTFVYTPSRVSCLFVESLDEAPNQPSFANIFF